MFRYGDAFYIEHDLLTCVGFVEHGLILKFDLFDAIYPFVKGCGFGFFKLNIVGIRDVVGLAVSLPEHVYEN